MREKQYEYASNLWHCQIQFKETVMVADNQTSTRGCLGLYFGDMKAGNGLLKHNRLFVHTLVFCYHHQYLCPLYWVWRQYHDNASQLVRQDCTIYRQSANQKCCSRLADGDSIVSWFRVMSNILSCCASEGNPRYSGPSCYCCTIDKSGYLLIFK